jgi:hypothetical protein
MRESVICSVTVDLHKGGFEFILVALIVDASLLGASFFFAFSSATSSRRKEDDIMSCVDEHGLFNGLGI